MVTKCLRRAFKLINELNYSSARDELLDAIKLNPANEILAEIHFQLGICYMKLDEFEAAEKHITLSGGILKSLGVTEASHIDDSLILLYKAAGYTQKLKELCVDILSRDSFNVEACVTLSDIYSSEMDYTKAKELIQKALEYKGDDINILKACIALEAKMKKYKDAIEHSEKFYKLHKGYDLTVNAAIGDLRLDIGPVRESIRLYEEVFDIVGDFEKYVLSNCMLPVSLYDEVYNKEKYLQIIKFRYEYTSKLERNICFDNEPRFFKRLRIGYLSDEFKAHPVGFFVAPVLRQSREGHSDFVCYNLIKPEYKDYVGDYIFNNAQAVMNLYGKNDDELEAFILSDKPDILMELKSTTKENKLELYARRLAPVQISWIGFPTSSGVAAIDYIISDRCVDPYPEAQELYTEKLLYLKDTFLCHELDIADNSKESPCLKNNYITFGCFNNYIKITDRMLKLWREILASVEGSRIIFKAGKYIDDYVAGLLRERLLLIGYDMDRVTIEGHESIDIYFKRYDDIDIILDTYPFNGATTTFDALLLGTPVITMTGETHASRVGLDLLSHVGLSDLACYSDEEYINKAVTLANDTARLAFFKQNLRDITKKSKLTDADAFRIEYEHAMRKAWIDYCIKKRNEGRVPYSAQNKDFNELREELLNGADYIRRSISGGELIDGRRELILEEYTNIQQAFMNEALSYRNTHGELAAMLERLSALIKRLRELDDRQIEKLMESNILLLEELI